MKDKDLLGKMKVDFLRDLPSEIDDLKKDLAMLRDKEKVVAERIKRRAHSIKSCASFFPDLEKMRDISYKMETLFLMIENDRLEPTHEILRLTEDTGDIIIRLGKGEDIDLTNMEALFNEYLNSTRIERMDTDKKIRENL